MPDPDKARRSEGRQFAAIAVTLGLLAIAHAVLTWPPAAVLVFFGGGAAIAFLAEAVAVNLGWLEHHVGPTLAGVPIYALLGWTSVVYAAFRIALLLADGWSAVLLAGILATGYDVLTDHYGVAAGHWTFTDDLPGPRFRGVPWWNFAGWFVVSCAIAALVLPLR